MTTTIALLLALQDAPAPLEDYFKFKAGTAWTYKHVENGVERKIAAKVSGESEGKVKVDWKETEKDGTTHSDSVITWSVVDGLLQLEAQGYTKEGNNFHLKLPVLKAGSKKDDTWTGDAGEFVHQGTVEVKVPAGTWKNAVRVRLKSGDEANPVKIDITLVPKVGLVKIEIQDLSGNENRWELLTRENKE